MTYTVTPIQAAALIGVTPTTVRRWIASGELDARKVGPRKWLIAVESVESLRLGTPATPAPTAPVVSRAELAADLKWLIAAESVEALRLGTTPAPTAPVVNLAELAGDIKIALGSLAIAAAAMREARAPRPPAPLTIRRAELAIEHARSALRSALDRLPPRSP